MATAAVSLAVQVLYVRQEVENLSEEMKKMAKLIGSVEEEIYNDSICLSV